MLEQEPNVSFDGVTKHLSIARGIADGRGDAKGQPSRIGRL